MKRKRFFQHLATVLAAIPFLGQNLQGKISRKESMVFLERDTSQSRGLPREYMSAHDCLREVMNEGSIYVDWSTGQTYVSRRYLCYDKLGRSIFEMRWDPLVP